MKVEKKVLAKSIIELIVEEDATKVAKHRQKAIDYIEKNATIKWFRKWTKIPEQILVKNYGEDYINSLTIEYAIDDIYKEVLKKEKIVPVANWEIKEIMSQSPLKIKIHIEVLPEVEIDKKYKNIKLKKKKISVTQKEVENAIWEIEQKFTSFKESDKKVEKWFRVTIDTDWYEWEKKLESTSMRDYPIIIWSNVLVPWFEDSIVWHKNQDEFEVDITFPDDYHNKAFASKKTKFKVKIKKVEESVKPLFDEDFIEKLRWKRLNLEWFKELIKEEIKETKEANERIQEENNLIEELLKVTKLDLWDSLIASQIEKVYAEIKENISKDWVKVSDYLQSLNLQEEDYKEKNVKPIAIKRLNWELILHKLMELEKIEVKEEEIKEEKDKFLSKFSSKDVLEKLETLYMPWTKYYEELKKRIWYRKLIDSFFE